VDDGGAVDAERTECLSAWAAVAEALDLQFSDNVGTVGLGAPPSTFNEGLHPIFFPPTEAGRFHSRPFCVLCHEVTVELSSGRYGQGQP